jgi:alpha-galactosidase
MVARCALVVGVVATLDLALAASDGLARRPMRGWNSWNWVGTSGCDNKCGGNMTGRCHSEWVMRGMADAVAGSKLKELGYDYINLSEGWPAQCFRDHTCSGRFSNGTIMHDPDRYPSGISALGDYVHSKGLKFGIYLDAGDVTCAGFPGSLGHEAEDIAMIASWGADYLWLDGCNLPAEQMTEKYELWSKLLNESGREIPWEVSWPAYTYHHTAGPGAGEKAGEDPFNTDLWWHSASVGHEFRFYNDNNAEWAHILDIAAFTHEARLSRFHRPGAWAFMDMLESGIGSLSFAESRAHFGLWVLMAQPLHLGLDLRSADPALMAVFENTQLITLAADDPLGKMGWRATMSEGRLNGTQVWARELSDGSMLIGLLNAGITSVDNCTWEQKTGGYYQVSPSSPAGNFECYGRGGLDQAKANCCAAGLEQCVSVDESDGSGCSKRNDDGGWVSDPNYTDWVITGGHKGKVVAPTATICANLSDVMLNPYSNVSVTDVWEGKDLGMKMGQFCAEVQSHDLALFLARQ